MPQHRPLTADGGQTRQFALGDQLVVPPFIFPAVDGAKNQVLTTDGSGNLSWSTPLTGSKMRSWLSTAQAALVSNTNTQVLLNSVQFDVLSEFNAAAHSFVALNSGYYWVKGSVKFDNTGSTASGNAFLYVNGAAVSADQVNGSRDNPIVSDLLHLNAGDSLQLWCTMSQTANVVVSQLYTYLALFRVG